MLITEHIRLILILKLLTQIFLCLILLRIIQKRCEIIMRLIIGLDHQSLVVNKHPKRSDGPPLVMVLAHHIALDLDPFGNVQGGLVWHGPVEVVGCETLGADTGVCGLAVEGSDVDLENDAA